MAASETLVFTEAVRCPVVFGSCRADQLAQLWDDRWRQVALIGDDQVLAVHGEGVASALRELAPRVERFGFPPGEANKTRATKARLEDALLAGGYTRRETCVVALGGGISLDVAGFVAATYARGVPHLAIPTTLLAMVDAAIGGKTGVNTEHGKNLVGAVRQPRGVLIDSALLATLPAAEWPNGLAELIKHAAIADAELLRWIEVHADELGAGPCAISDAPLARCVTIKGRIVQADQHERGLRSVLNFGHTIGHAVEHATRHRVSHGLAVAWGMRVEAAVATERCDFPRADHRRLVALLERLVPAPPTLPPFAELKPFLARDKKSDARGLLRLALPRAIGVMARAADGEHTLAVTEEALSAAWQAELERGR